MDIESRKNEEKDAFKKVDLEIEVRYILLARARQAILRMRHHAGHAQQISGHFVRHAI